MSKALLDASAILAYLFDETGAGVVSEVLKDGHGCISTVNYAEVASKLVDVEMPADIIREALTSLELDVIEFSAEHALQSGELRKVSKHLGLSLGDRACLATAKVESLPVLTADKAWDRLSDSYQITLIRE